MQLSLNDAIETGLKNNPEIRLSAEKIRASEGRFWSGISLPKPELSVSYEYVPLSKGLDSYSERSFEVNQSFEFPANYFLRGSMLSNEKEIAENEFMLTELKIIADIKTAYFITLARSEKLIIAEEILSISEEILNKEEIRYKVGEGTNLERLTAKLQYTQAANEVEVLKNQLAKAYTDLNYTLGNVKEIKYHLSDSLWLFSINPNTGSFLESALKEHPKLKTSELRVRSSSTGKALAWSGLLPEFSIGYFRQSLDGNNNYYGASFGISVPLWFIFDNRGRIEESAANLSSAEQEVQLIKNEIYNKVSNAYADFKNEERQVQLYKTEILLQAEEIYNTARINYESGEITYTDFLPAKQVFISSRNNYIDALLSYNLSLVSLEEAVGKRLR